MIRLREAEPSDIDFLVETDHKDEGNSSASVDDWEPDEIAEHQEKIAAFVSDDDKAAWVFEDTETGGQIGTILWRFRNRLHERFESWSIIPDLDERLFPPDGAFCEIFQLWVAPAYRRRGLATRLKQQAESESLRRGVMMVYTHTEERNAHVIAMNVKLGYREVRRGPLWDDVVRVSLIQSLG